MNHRPQVICTQKCTAGRSSFTVNKNLYTCQQKLVYMYIYFVVILSLCCDCCMCCDRYNHWVHEDLCFTLYIYLSTVQFTLFINQPFIECYVYLYLSLIYIILFSVLSWWRLSLLYCCTCDLSTVTCSVCQFVCVFCIFRIPLCINVKVWNNSLLWQPNMCTTIRKNG